MSRIPAPATEQSTSNRAASPRRFRRRLRERREALGWSQAELAMRSGLQQSALSHYETGLRRPSFTNLRRLASALGVSTDFLVGHEPSPGAEADDPDVRKLARQITLLAPADRERVRSLVASLARKAR